MRMDSRSAGISSYGRFLLGHPAQDTMKKGDKGWTGLEKTLADVNNQWICAYKYHKNHAQDCVDFKTQFWPDTFFEISRQGEVTDKMEMVKEQTATDTAHPVSPGRCGAESSEFQINGSLRKCRTRHGSHGFSRPLTLTARLL